ncbi:MAG UNVERIFIED_CONTAM: superoxide dismutase [Rickettsiaceae bacterium]
MVFSQEANQEQGPFILQALPYDKNALLPFITEETLEFHHGKHHNAYVVNLNKLLENHPLKSASLEKIIQESANKADMAGVFNNAAQIWNHTFYWHSMKQNGGGKPEGDLLSQIEKDFGSFEDFVAKFKEAATTQFASGWAWLVWDKQSLKIVKTANALVPITDGLFPLITCDVWEHAYYIDFRNRRPDYVTTFLENLVNWDFASKNFSKCK